MKTALILGLVSLIALPLAAREFRDFTDVKGRTINAELLDMQEGKVKIRSQSQVFEIPLETLSEADRTWLAEWDAKRKGNEEDLYYSEEIFADDFSGEGFGERWGHYKSESVIQDGVLTGKTIDINDHAGVDSIRFEGRQDMEVSLKFNFAGEQAERFNVWFDDKDYQGSHAGHIASVSISPTSVQISDAKTGNMENSIYEKKNAPGGLDEETKKMLETKSARFDVELKREEWHTLRIRTKGPLVTVEIDEDEVGEFESEGNAHATKSLVSLTTNINDVQYDDFSIKAAPSDSVASSGEN
ncbi:MAG: hypothetical protein KDN19_04100 [Verrucomicrobiae bacterium]|nr:hypothetical protein [Verrucomicrobiae bacterium]